ncbi:MAG TPA: CorA family divalent cation transporter [Acidimicrobiia bacterium]|nr:CorA family divalent cation transporter [Acidimicrobiia bacterium]
MPSTNYQRLAERLERALDAVDTTREMVVGSFDIFMTRTAQETNDIMKRLTIISVLLLPGGGDRGDHGDELRSVLPRHPVDVLRCAGDDGSARRPDARRGPAHSWM